MKQLEIKQMEKIEGGDNAAQTATGFMCGAAGALLFTGPFAVLATPFAVGCAVGLLAAK